MKANNLQWLRTKLFHNRNYIPRNSLTSFAMIGNLAAPEDIKSENIKFLQEKHSNP